MKKKQQIVAFLMLAMRITIAQLILATVFIASLYANGAYSQKIMEKTFSLSAENVKIEKLIQEVQKATKVKFSFSNTSIQSDKVVSYTAQNKKIIDFINDVLIPNGISYTVVNNSIVLFIQQSEKKLAISNTAMINSPDDAMPPDRIIKGTVVDEKGVPIEGVTIAVKNGKSKGITDKSGRFNFKVNDNETTLVFTSVQYITVEKTIGQSTEFNITLKESTGVLSDVVVVAFGSQKKISLTGAVGTVSAKDVVSTPVSNITNALIGNTPGISGLQQSGEPGRNSTNIYIRGLSTFAGNSQPLIVIDGIEQAAERPYDQLNAMDANEISSISVLKDASASAVYGIRGANGVIIVTTKRGTLGKPTLSFSSNFGTTKATSLMNTVNSAQYAEMRNGAVNIYNNSLNNPTYNPLLFTADDIWKFQNNRDYTPAEVDAMSQLTADQKAQLKASPALYYTSHDLYKDMFGGVGPQQQYNLSVRGGTDKLKYYTSVGYFSQGSILANATFMGASTASTFERGNFRSNFDILPFKNLTVSVNIAGQFGTTAGPAAVSTTGVVTGPTDWANRYKTILGTIQEGNPFVVQPFVDGHLISTINGPAGSASNPLGLKGSGASMANPIGNLLTSGRGTTFNTLLTSSVKINYLMNFITKGLSFNATGNFDDNFNKYSQISQSLPVFSVRRNLSNPNNYDFYGGAVGATGFTPTNYNSTWHKYYVDAGFNYSRVFGSHTVTAVAMGKASQYYMPSDAFNTPSGIMGLLGRVTYNYKERYFADVTAGYNGTENFAPDKRFGFFPAFSGSWVATNENFFPKNNYVTFLKVRGSYGEVGNDLINGRRYLYLPNTYNLNNQQGLFLGTSNGSAPNPYTAGSNEGALGNPNVTWEKSKTSNFGLDMRFLKDKLSLTFDLFKQDRTNILTVASITSAVAGFGGNIPPVNIGITTNHGYELSLGWSDKIKDFGYSITGMLSYAKNKVIYKAEVPNPYEWQNQTGRAIGQYFGLTSDGLFNTSQELANRPYDSYNSNQNVLGDIRYKDLNGDGIIDSKDMSPMGFTNLPEYTYSMRLKFNYKNFDISALFNGSANGSFYLNSTITGVFYKGWGMAYDWQYQGVWTPEKVANGTPISYPRPEINSSSSYSNFTNSDFWLKSSDFIKLKNVEIGYNVTNLKFLKNTSVSSIRLYFNGSNLLIIKDHLSKYGIDPETQDVNSAYIYPITRAFNFGVNIQF